MYVIVRVRPWRRLFRAANELRCWECDLRELDVDAIPVPPPLRAKGPGTEICRFCREPIESNSDIWWLAGTCGSDCGPAPDHLHQPVEPNLRDQAELERWLES